MMSRSLADYTRDEIETLLVERGEPPYRGRQLFRGIYARGVRSVSAVSDLPQALRDRLAGSFPLGIPEIAERYLSRDGTRKYLLRLADARTIEAVLIPEAARLTACLSTQVGCALACAFCVTGTVGLTRNLSAGEIAGQMVALRRDLRPKERITHLVLMGMGEPLHNYDETVRALRILTDPLGLGYPARRITLSTVGLVPQIQRLGAARLGVNLAVSLHAATDAVRDRLVPINKKYPLAELLQACREYPLGERQRITFEYVLIAGVNDGPGEAQRLAEILRGLRYKINLIPLNEAPEIPFHRPAPETVRAFQGILRDRGVLVTLRQTKGGDISAACGLLRGRAHKGLDTGTPLS